MVGVVRQAAQFAAGRCHGMGDCPDAAAAPPDGAGAAGAGIPYPNSGRRETETGTRASCTLIGLRRPVSRSRTREPGASGRPGGPGWLRTVGGADCSSAGPATEWGGWVQVKLKVSRIAVGSAVTLSLVGGGLLAAPDAAAQCVAGYDDKGEAIVAPAAVMITGGTVTNETVIDISANAGTSISDASGGNNNLALTGGGNDGGEGGIDTASSGNGGVATSSADGGAVSIQDINTGGNVGNAILVGDTTRAPFTPPAPEKPKEAPKEKGKAPRPEKVVALPDTGVGIGDTSALFALITSAGAAAASLGLRRR